MKKTKTKNPTPAASDDDGKGQPVTITSEQLCNLTGLSNRRHRQLATDGYAVPAGRGKFEFTATIRGIFRFYQERSGTKMSDLLKFEAHRKLKIANDRASGQLVHKDSLDAQLHQIHHGASQILRRSLIDTYPLAVAGMNDIIQVRIFGRKLYDQIVGEIQKLSDTLPD